MELSDNQVPDIRTINAFEDNYVWRLVVGYIEEQQEDMISILKTEKACNKLMEAQAYNDAFDNVLNFIDDLKNKSEQIDKQSKQNKEEEDEY